MISVKTKKKIIAVFLVMAFVMTVFTVIGSGDNHVNASAKVSNDISLSSFSFPYQYGTPTVPSNIGAQGVQGPLTHPILSVSGAHGNIGTNYNFNFFNPPNITLTISVYNGTFQSHTQAINQIVKIVNTTTNKAYNGNTNTTGKVSFIIPAGFYQICVTSSNTLDYSSYIYSKYIMSSQILNVYLLPTSLSVKPINNGGDVDQWFQVHGSITGYAYAVNVTLLNSSSSNSPLGTAVSLLNGSVEFTGLNTTYSYSLIIDGYKQYFNSMTYYLSNLTTGTISIPLNPSNFYLGLDQINTGTAKTTNIASETEGSSSSFSPNDSSVPSTISNGTYYMRNYIDGNGGILYVNNTIFVMETTYGRSTDFSKVIFNNSFMIWDYAVYSFILSNQELVFDNSTIIFSNVEPQDFAGNTWIYYNVNSFRSSIYFGTFSHQYFGDNVTITDSDIYGNTQINVYGESYTSINVSHALSEGIGFNSYTASSQMTFYDDILNNGSIGQTESNNSYNANIIGSVLYFHNLSLSTPINLEVGKLLNTTIDTYSTPIPSTAVLTATDIQNTSICAEFNIVSSGSNRGIIYDSPSTNGFKLEHSYISGLVSFEPYGNNTIIENNIFSNQSAIGTTQLGINYNGASKPSYNAYVENNTFGPIWANYSAYWFLMGGGNGGGSTEFVSGYNYPSYNLILMHNTFYTAPIWGGGAGTSQILYLSGGNISYNAFYDNESYGTSPYKLTLPSEVIDIGDNNNFHYATSLNITDNYFLNLNNETYAIGNSNYGDANIKLNISDNHFYFNPYISYKGLKPTQQFSDVWGGKGYAYQLYTTQNTTKINNSQLIYNTGKVISLPYMSPAPQYVVAPDVSIASGTPIISYSNGLVGGPQPNFTWKGYNYSESVEPNYIQIGVNSSKAPSVILQFHENPGTYYLYGMNGNGVFENITVTPNSNGIINATYNPATMPLDPVFEVVPHIVTTTTHIPPSDFYTKFIVISSGFLVLMAVIYVATKSQGGKTTGGGRKI